MTELMLVRTNAKNPSSLQHSPARCRRFLQWADTPVGPRIVWEFGYFIKNWKMAFMCRGNNDWAWKGLKEKMGRSLLPPAHPKSLDFGQGLGQRRSQRPGIWRQEKTGLSTSPWLLRCPHLHPWVLSSHLQLPRSLPQPRGRSSLCPQTHTHTQRTRPSFQAANGLLQTQCCCK